MVRLGGRLAASLLLFVATQHVAMAVRGDRTVVSDNTTFFDNTTPSDAPMVPEEVALVVWGDDGSNALDENVLEGIVGVDTGASLLEAPEVGVDAGASILDLGPVGRTKGKRRPNMREMRVFIRAGNSEHCGEAESCKKCGDRLRAAAKQRKKAFKRANLAGNLVEAAIDRARKRANSRTVAAGKRARETNDEALSTVKTFIVLVDEWAKKCLAADEERASVDDVSYEDPSDFVSEGLGIIFKDLFSKMNDQLRAHRLNPSTEAYDLVMSLKEKAIKKCIVLEEADDLWALAVTKLEYLDLGGAGIQVLKSAARKATFTARKKTEKLYREERRAAAERAKERRQQKGFVDPSADNKRKREGTGREDPAKKRRQHNGFVDHSADNEKKRGRTDGEDRAKKRRKNDKKDIEQRESKNPAQQRIARSSVQPYSPKPTCDEQAANKRDAPSCKNGSKEKVWHCKNGESVVVRVCTRNDEGLQGLRDALTELSEKNRGDYVKSAKNCIAWGSKTRGGLVKKCESVVDKFAALYNTWTDQKKESKAYKTKWVGDNNDPAR